MSYFDRYARSHRSIRAFTSTVMSVHNDRCETTSIRDKKRKLTDATENFDGQVNALYSAKSSLDESTKALIEAKADMNTARLSLDNASTNANAAVDTIDGKVDELKKTRIKSEVEPQ